MKRAIIAIVLLLVLSMVLIGCAPSNDKIEGNSGHEVGDTVDQEDDKTENIPPSVEDDPPSSGDEIEPEINETPEVISMDMVAIVKATRLNIREKMSSKSRVLGTMKEGEGLSLIKVHDNGWLSVYYKGKEAYIYGSYVNIVSIPKSSNDAIESVLDEGKRLMGYPYVWGSQRYHFGNGIRNQKFEMGKFDCSALTQYILYKGAGIVINVTTRTQVLEGELVRDKVSRGDLMFFTNSARKHRKGIERVGHVAIYLGDNYILHTADDYAVIEEISSARWSNYLVSKRFF